MATLSSDVINFALTIIGVLAAGETPAPEDSVYALAVLNTLLEHWNVEGLQIFTVTNVQKSLTAAKQSYTMGTGGDINAQRPVRIEEAGIIRGGVRTPLVPLNVKEWARELSRTATDILPQKIYNDNSFDSNGRTTLSLLPIPSDNNCTLDLFVWAQLGDGFAIGDTVSFPPGYLKAIQYNLAVDLAPAFGRPVDPNVFQIAQASKQELRAVNAAVAIEMEARPPMPPPGQPQQ